MIKHEFSPHKTGLACTVCGFADGNGPHSKRPPMRIKYELSSSSATRSVDIDEKDAAKALQLGGREALREMVQTDIDLDVRHNVSAVVTESMLDDLVSRLSIKKGGTK